MSAATAQRDVVPWYRQLWPWGLMAGPLVVVVASSVTFWIAARGSDAMVVDDYYKQGTAINQSIERDLEATKLGLAAQVKFPPHTGGPLQVAMTSQRGLAWPPAIQILLVHPVKVELDRKIELRLTSAQTNAASYVGEVGPTENIAYQITLQDFGNKWRLLNDTRGAAHDVVMLHAEPAEAGHSAHEAADSAAGG